MYEKNQHNHKTPDLTKMQAVVIDHRTTIYLEPGADVEEAKKRYLSRLNNKNTK